VRGGSLANAIITGLIESNEGLVSNITFKKTAVLEGGHVTNFITNKGLMKNFTFVGQQIQGGTLSGIIIIASQVHNEIRDVILAAGTVIQGKVGKEFVTAKLAGKITGDATDPALLENVTITDNAELKNVILGEGVILGQNVTQKNVMIVCTQQRANGKGFNKGGFPFDDDQTCFAVQENAVTLTLDSVSDLLGQAAEPLFVVVHGQKAFIFTQEWQDWDGELGTLQSGSNLNLKAVQTLVLPDRSQFTGDFKLYAGLRLTDGTILYHQVQ
jgi:NDP-sugar pyrophosphorylase family protein